MRSPLLLPALFLLACNRQPAPKPVASAAHPAVLVPGAAQPTGTIVAGKVLERIDAATYSYLRLDTLGGEQWAAVPKCELKAGDGAVVSHAMLMDGFESKTLGRKFEHIVFGILDSPGATAPSAKGAPSPHVEMAEPHAGGQPHGSDQPASAPPADIGPTKVVRATGPGAATVAEVFAKKATLDNKPVRVHAKVVKVLPGIMGKNWLHVRDGSGSADKSDNDLTITTQDVATVGSEVLIEGTVHADKDFGSGYTFSAIVEDAKVTK
ncbi:MAG TPA: nucleotide-binding protein [Polyangia bacterium]